MATVTFDNGMAEIPDFALDATARDIATHTGLAVGVLKSIMRGNKISSAGLKKMEEHLKVANKQDEVANTNDRKDNKKAEQDRAQQRAIAKKNFETNAKQMTQGFKSIADGNTSLKGALLPIVMGVGGIATNLAKASGFFNKKLGGVAQALIGGATDMAAATTGFALGVTDTFIQEAQKMSTIAGGGLYTSMLDLRVAAGEAGLRLSHLSSGLEQNSIAIGGLGDNVDAGMKEFAGMSGRFKGVTEQFGHFGMNVNEINALMLDYIDSQQRMGKSTDTINKALSSTSGGLNALLYETTAMANITGADRRELLRDRMSEKLDPLQALYLKSLNQNEATAQEASANALTAIFGSQGKTLAMAGNIANQSGMDIATVLRNMSGGQELLDLNMLLGGNQVIDVIEAYNRRDIGSFAGLADSFMNSLQSEDFTRIAITGRTASGGAMAGMSMLQDIMQRMGNNAGQAGPMFDQTMAEAGANPQLGTVYRNIESEFNAVMAKVAASGVKIPGTDQVLRVGDAAGIASLTNSTVEMLKTLTGSDDISEGLSNTQLATIASIFMARNMLDQPGDGGGGGGGSLDPDVVLGGGSADKSGKNNKPGNRGNFWKNLFSGIKRNGLKIAMGAAGLVVSAGATVIGGLSTPVLLAIAGVVAAGAAGFGIYKYATSGDGTEPTNKDDMNRQITTAVNNIRKANLGDIMAGLDIEKTSEADLLTRIGVISEKGHQEQIALLKEIRDDVDESRIHAFNHLNVKEAEMRNRGFDS